jgi:hypothetical protein
LSSNISLPRQIAARYGCIVKQTAPHHIPVRQATSVPAAASPRNQAPANSAKLKTPKNG